MFVSNDHKHHVLLTEHCMDSTDVSQDFLRVAHQPCVAGDHAGTPGEDGFVHVPPEGLLQINHCRAAPTGTLSNIH